MPWCASPSRPAAGKNTADIALALDAIEAPFDHRADKFCLVTSDSDFAYLCRKLRNASDQFFEWQAEPVAATEPAASVTAEKPGPPPPAVKRRPKFGADAVGLLDMLRTYDLLALKKAEGGHYTVALRGETTGKGEMPH